MILQLNYCIISNFSICRKRKGSKPKKKKTTHCYRGEQFKVDFRCNTVVIIGYNTAAVYSEYPIWLDNNDDDNRKKQNKKEEDEDDTYMCTSNNDKKKKKDNVDDVYSDYSFLNWDINLQFFSFFFLISNK